MSFKKIFNEDAIPEWRSKYIDYELGLKKLKALRLSNRDLKVGESTARDDPYRPTGQLRRTATGGTEDQSPSQRIRRKPLSSDLPTSQQHVLSHEVDVIEGESAPGSNIDDDRQLPTVGPSMQTSEATNEPPLAHLGSQEPLISSKPTDTPRPPRFRSSLHRRPSQAPDARNLEYRHKRSEFIAWIDQELEKVETFYKSKETEAELRLRLLLDQFRELKTHRGSLPDVAGSRSRIRIRRIRSASSGLFSPSAKVDPKSPRSSRLSRLRLDTIAYWNKSKNRSNDRTQSGMPLQSLSGIEEQQTSGNLLDPRQDAVRRKPKPTVKEMDYRTARKQLKKAVQEHYRGLELIKSYAMLNRSAFQKLSRKYDRIVGESFQIDYMNKVSKAWFVESDLVEHQLAATEELFARHFERGNRKVAASKLKTRVVTAADFSWSMARTGIFLGSGLILAIEGLIESIELFGLEDRKVRVQTEYILQLYGAYFLCLVLFLLFCVSCWIWALHHINYIFIFGFDPAHCLTWQQRMEIPSIFFFSLGFFMYITFSIEDDVTGLHTQFTTILFGLSILLMFLPVKAIYHKSRSWWAYSNWRLLASGLYTVEFRDFFLGDMYCSLTYFTGAIYMFFCLLVTDWRRPRACGSQESRAFGAFTCIPAILRVVQCIRRYYDTRNAFPHLANACKYVLTIVTLMILSLWRIGDIPRLRAVFIVFATLNAIICSLWDVVYDWSLGNPYSKHPFLRNVLAYKKPWIYYIAILLDVTFRFNWIFYAIYEEQIQSHSRMNFAIAFSEVIRRWIWTTFRVENEHCANLTQFRAHGDVVLPFLCHEQAAPVNVAQAEAGHDTVNYSAVANTTESGAQQFLHDLEHGDRPMTGVDGADDTIPEGHSRPRRQESTLSRMGTIFMRAHTEDFERRDPTGLDDANEEDESSGGEKDDMAPESSEDEDGR